MRRFLIQSTAIAALLAAPVLAFAGETADDDDITQLDDLVASASRGDAGRADALGASVTLISPAQMEDRGTRVVSDILRDVPGVAVNRGGPIGQFSEVRIRGGEGNHTLVLIDGLDAGDPFQGQFDFSTLIADDVARIEVLRGQQSSLYGSQAIGGVISYITATGAEAPGLRGRIEGGTNNTLAASVRQTGVAGKLDYALSGAWFSTDGEPGAVGGTRDVNYQDFNLVGKATLTLSDTARVRAMARYNNMQADDLSEDFDADFNTGIPVNPATYGRFIDGSGDIESRALMGLVRGEADLMDGRLKTALTLQGNETDRRAHTAGALTSGSEGTRTKATAQATWKFGGEDAAQALTLAVDDKRETYLNIPVGAPTPTNTRRVLNNIGYVAEYEGVFAGHLGLGASVRHDQNERFANADTWRAQASYGLMNGLRLRVAAGTGLAAPTNFELFGFDPVSFVGNPNLMPETSRGWEAGFDFAPDSRRYSVAVTWFDSRLKDEIFTRFLPGFLSTPENRTTVSVQNGVEAALNVRVNNKLDAFAAWTHLTAEEGGGLPEVRRPENAGSVNLTWHDEKTAATLTVRYTGEFRDFDFTDPFAFPSPRRLMPAYTLVNLSVSREIGSGAQVFVRVDNLFDEDYQEQYTAVSPGRSAVIGLRKGF